MTQPSDQLGRYRVVANFGATLALLPMEDSPTAEVESSVTQATPIRKLPLIVAGDEVLAMVDDGGSYRVTELVSRASVLERVDRRGAMKPLCANLSHLAIVSAEPPGIDTLLIDQFCLAAHRAGVDALIIINKSDNYDADTLADIQSLLDVYQAVGYPTFLVNTRDSEAMAELQAGLAMRTLVMVGASGVGKSSIIQQLLPAESIRVGAVSAATGLGSHTTSVTCWYRLPQGGAIIDSPGVRQYSVSHLDEVAIRLGYLEMRDASDDCRFANCTHAAEPGCAVKLAVEEGRIATWRYANYLKLLEAAPD